VTNERNTTRAVGVLGIGTLGITVAQLALDSGRSVVLVVRPEPGKVERGIAALESSLAREVRGGRLSPEVAAGARKRAVVTDDPSRLEECGVVIESVLEDVDAKQHALAVIENVVTDDCVIASTTSTIPVAWIANHALEPARVVVAHYVWPANRVPLVEVSLPDSVTPEVRQRLDLMLAEQRKTPLFVRDTPGFLITRVLFGYWAEVVRLLVDGVSPVEIDGMLEAGGWPIGPCRMLDGTGLTTPLRALRVVDQVMAGRSDPIGELQPVVDAGFVNHRTGGLYLHEDGNRRPNEGALELLRHASRPAPPDLVDRVTGAVVNEAAWCVAEGVVESWEDAALGIDGAYGFPGGLIGYLHAIGPRKLADRLARLAEVHGSHFLPCPILRDGPGSAK